jgi:hypothetical protein
LDVSGYRNKDISRLGDVLTSQAKIVRIYPFRSSVDVSGYRNKDFYPLQEFGLFRPKE